MANRDVPQFVTLSHWECISVDAVSDRRWDLYTKCWDGDQMVPFVRVAVKDAWEMAALLRPAFPEMASELEDKWLP